MKKHLKYLITLFLAFAVIASDGALNSNSKPADYYQSSRVIVNKELDSKNSRLYKFSFTKSTGNISFPIFIIYKNVKEVFSFQIQIILKIRKNLHQKINSFVEQSVFMNEVINSGNFHKGLYIA